MEHSNEKHLINLRLVMIVIITVIVTAVTLEIAFALMDWMLRTHEAVQTTYTR